MNSLTSQQRKLVYLGGIVILLIPIIALGMPATEEEGSGGQLAKLRENYQLGETTLGKVDPSSASMNLVLLGLRGVASTKLWIDANEQQKRKDWGRLRATTDSIILLQPHFIKVWQFQGWNLAYNVSAEWDGVPDRYYWVKEGIKFTEDGTAQNQQIPELYYEVGRMLSQKIGESDEWKYFRRYFLDDPDPDISGPDPEINPEGKDNYLVAYDWFTLSNLREETHEQHVMARILFRANPARSLIGYAQALQKEGRFEERTREAWSRAYNEWTGVYGKELFMSPGGVIQMEADEKTLQALSNSDGVDLATKRGWWQRYQDQVNYRYWRTLARSERDPETNEAHRLIYRGKQLYREGKTTPRGPDGELPSEAQETLEAGMRKLEEVYERYPTLVTEDVAIEDAMLALLYYFAIFELNGEPRPEQFPLKSIWDNNQNRVPYLEDQFIREIR